jgi:predicted small lipoprotein YifL
VRTPSHIVPLVPVVLVALAALTGCGSSGAPGSAALVVTYVDAGVEQRVEVEAAATLCDDGDPRLLSTDEPVSADRRIAVLVDATGAATFRVRVGHELEFLSTKTAPATGSGVTVKKLEGVVVQAGTAGLQTQLSDQAYVSGSVTCPG